MRQRERQKEVNEREREREPSRARPPTENRTHKSRHCEEDISKSYSSPTLSKSSSSPTLSSRYHAWHSTDKCPAYATVPVTLLSAARYLLPILSLAYWNASIFTTVYGTLSASKSLRGGVWGGGVNGKGRFERIKKPNKRSKACHTRELKHVIPLTKPVSVHRALSAITETIGQRQSARLAQRNSYVAHHHTCARPNH